MRANRLVSTTIRCPGGGLFGAVGDEHIGASQFRTDRSQIVLQTFAVNASRAANSFVEKQQGGFRRQRPGDRHPLLLAAEISQMRRLSTSTDRPVRAVPCGGRAADPSAPQHI